VLGETLGPYRILGTLGERGMGDVYRATDTTLNREVAIKVLRSSERSRGASPRPVSSRGADPRHAESREHRRHLRAREGAGVVVYEMLTARLFEGETLSDVIAAVLTREPDCRPFPLAGAG